MSKVALVIFCLGILLAILYIFITDRLTPFPFPALSPIANPQSTLTFSPTPIVEKQSFHLYTRVTRETWPHLRPYAREGDLYWGPVREVPLSMRALTFPSYTILTSKGNDETLKDYAAINLDGEYKDFAQALSEAKQIREFVDSYNDRHATDRIKKLRFVAFYHLNIINAYPEIVQYPDIVLFGKANWSALTIEENAKKYVSLIQKAGKTPGILLGDSKVDFTGEELTANFHKVIDSPPDGLGLSIVGFYYPQSKDDSLIFALQSLGKNK